jgi:tetrahydromethanopterin S-methyltransferase subunit C
MTIGPLNGAMLGAVLAAVDGAVLGALDAPLDGAVLAPLLEQALKATAPISASAAIGLVMDMVTCSILLKGRTSSRTVRLGDSPLGLTGHTVARRYQRTFGPLLRVC